MNIIERANKPLNTQLLRQGEIAQNDHKVHVTGEGYEKKIKQILGYENDRDFVLKKELSKPITKYLYKLIIDEQNRWINSDCHKSYHWRGTEKSTEFNDYLKTVWKGQSVENLTRNFIKDALYSEFNGFLFVERTEPVTDVNGNPIESGKPYIVFIPVSQVWDFTADGNTIKYFCYRIDPLSNNILRWIDPTGDYLLKKDQGKYKIVDTLPNILGYVPIIQLSTKVKDLLIDEVRTSYIDQSIPIADNYLTLHAEHIITCILHGHPIQYITAQRCNYETEGGEKCENGEIGTNADGTIKKCPRCKGSGTITPRDTSDILKLPQLDAEGKPYSIPSPGGFISSPVESLTEQRKELDWLEEKLLMSTLGTNTLKETTIETATEAVMNSKSLENINNNIVSNVESVIMFIVDTIGKYLYGNTYVSCWYRWNRQFNLKNETALMKESEAGKLAGASYSYLFENGKDIVRAKYANNPEMLARMLAMYQLEPYPFLSTKETVELPNISLKNNFNEVVLILEQEQKMSIDVILIKYGYKETLDKLYAILEILPGNTEQSVNLPDGDQGKTLSVLPSGMSNNSPDVL